MTEKPIILEHHGIKEIVSQDDLKKVESEELLPCHLCSHYNCVCDLHD